MTRLARVCFAIVLLAASALFAGVFAACGRTGLDLDIPIVTHDAGPDVESDGTPTGPCQTNADCASTPSTPYCEVPPGQCVACLTDQECPAGDACNDFHCVPLCQGGTCTGSLSCCSPFCVNEGTDPNNCGGCGLACPPGEACISSTCQVPTNCNGGPPCSVTDQCCGTGCSDVLSDPNNCGGCGFACLPGATCVGGACSMPTSCNGGPPCMGADECCGSGCTDTTSDPNNCGTCGFACPPGTTCMSGACTIPTSCNGGPVCMGTQQCCMTGCTDTTTDPNNCGGCGMPCPPGAICASSACQMPANCNGGPPCTGGEECCGSGCVDTTSDPKNCGHCGSLCPTGDTCVTGTCTPATTCNGGPACSPTQTCCVTGCADTSSDPNNCGQCGVTCAAPGTCVDGSCVVDEGALDPTVNPTFLTPGVHTYTTINIPAGVTVYVAGPGPQSGTLDLQASGNIIVDGTIDVSGGPGTQNLITSQSTESGRAGAGGYTGEPYQSAGPSAACSFVGGNPGLLGIAAQGSPGSCAIISTTVCVSLQDPAAEVFTAPLAAYGGGAGVFTGFRAYGSGGGGVAGGAPGVLGAAVQGESDCGGVAGGGGAISGQGGLGGGGPYDGTAGVSGQTQCAGIMGFPPAYVGGGGGGSIGAIASSDLPVLTTFQTGSGGGGGSADYLNRPEFGGTSGGGGGGGALKLSTPATLTVNGQLLANGGTGGDAYIGTGTNANCNPQPGAAGGGGSGGVIYLSAPNLVVGGGATISAGGGGGGAGSEFASGGGGGSGGLGRIRISATPASCTLGGAFNPPLSSGCAVTSPGGSGHAYIGVYPN